ncbi:MAG: putative peptidoglycan-binding domain-containing protein [Chthoniobacterales bacterium]
MAKKKRKTAPPAARSQKKSASSMGTLQRKKVAGKPAPAPEIRRAIPLDYLTTEDSFLRATPDLAARKVTNGMLDQGTRVRLAPQDWWYVEVDHPKAASGFLRGWLPPTVLRPIEAEEQLGGSMTRLPTPSEDSAPRLEGRKRMAASIVNFEARRDAQGHLQVYVLPAGDGGGRFEVAGINDRYHPREASKLRELIETGHYKEAEDYATEVVADYTDVVANWTGVPMLEVYLRDSAFHRGPTGAARILQMALGVKVDGLVGPKTLSALRAAEKDPVHLLLALRIAREEYELKVAGPRQKFWRGLVHRWDDSLDFARQLG